MVMRHPNINATAATYAINQSRQRFGHMRYLTAKT
jgi:hypothetical protein